ncbi:MAG: DUF3369 domain-containing protein [Bacillota bacterium]
MAGNTDAVVFADEDMLNHSTGNNNWKLLVVDDDIEVHNVTKMVLGEFCFDKKGIDIISAFSAQEAIELISKHPDTALILLDVVMEEEDSGLKVVQFIRSVLRNSLVRIILRTGQPGQAPEEKIILEYDINDYKEKTELTVQKLYTTVVAALRSYRDLMIIEHSKQGLEKIIESSANIFELQSMKEFATGVLTQLTSILGLNKNSLYCRTSSFAATKDIDNSFYILAATGDYYKYIDEKIHNILDKELYSMIERAFVEKRNIFENNKFIIYFQSKNNIENLIYMEGIDGMNKWDIDLIEIFSTNVSIAFDNIYLNKEVIDTQKEIIFTLGEIVEARSKETGNHVRKVAEYCKVLALGYGLPEEEAEVLKLASPMHDIGKLAVPDSILMKPGKLTEEEFQVIKTHTTVGYEMLKNSHQDIMKAAVLIAMQHHERYDGTGYPSGLLGENIHIFGRITALADVFDALGSERVYKKAWELVDILEYIKEQRGRHFDPKLVDIFFDKLDVILRIKNSYDN